jgi:hypothetical protein
VVQRKGGTEDITVAKVTSLKNGTVNFNDGNKSRAVKADAIIAINTRSTARTAAPKDTRGS